MLYFLYRRLKNYKLTLSGSFSGRSSLFYFHLYAFERICVPLPKVPSHAIFTNSAVRLVTAVQVGIRAGRVPPRPMPLGCTATGHFLVIVFVECRELLHAEVYKAVICNDNCQLKTINSFKRKLFLFNICRHIR